MSDQTHQTKTEEGDDLVQRLRDESSEWPLGSPTNELFIYVAQQLSEAFDYQENLERGQLADNMHIAKLETALNGSLAAGVAIAEKVAALEAALAAANDRANNAEQALANIAKLGKVYAYPADWNCHKQGGSPAFDDCDVVDLAEMCHPASERPLPMAGVTERLSAQGVRYLHHADAVPAPATMLGYVP